MSDHSSHFDSVLGTAINLGIHSVNEKGSLTHPKVSVLAREAKELQGVWSPPSPSPVPPTQASTAPAPKKDEGTVFFKNILILSTVVPHSPQTQFQK